MLSRVRRSMCLVQKLMTAGAFLLQEQYVVITDESLQRTSTGYNVLMQQLELVALTRNAVLDP